MKWNITDYNTLVFDCDGVVLNSNKVKTDAFYHAALPYGESAAQQLVNYHIQNGGVSRYKKFAYFLEVIVNGGQGDLELDELLLRYSHEVYDGLMNCEVAQGLNDLREKTAHARWLIVSGGDQKELRKVFAARKLISMFDGGIFGSPDSKEEIISRELESNNIRPQALFIGDSRYDYEASSKFGIDFCYISQWSEWQVAPSFQKKFKFDLKSISEFFGSKIEVPACLKK